ncbi:hypothetical protein JZ751_026938, partial [Albula glossodonta]
AGNHKQQGEFGGKVVKLCLVPQNFSLFSCYVCHVLCGALSSSQAPHPGEDELTEGEASPVEIPNHRPDTPTQDRATQTEWTLSSRPMAPGKVLLAQTRAVQSLSLEDALLPEVLERLEGVLEEGEMDEGEPSWTSMVEEPIQPSCIKALMQASSHPEGTCQPKRDSPDSQGEAKGDPAPGSAPSPAPTPSQERTTGSASPNSRNQPLSPVLEGEKTQLCVPLNVSYLTSSTPPCSFFYPSPAAPLPSFCSSHTSSEHLSPHPPSWRDCMLGRKTVSSTNLLTRSPSLEKLSPTAHPLPYCSPSPLLLHKSPIGHLLLFTVFPLCYCSPTPCFSPTALLLQCCSPFPRPVFQFDCINHLPRLTRLTPLIECFHSRAKDLISSSGTRRATYGQGHSIKMFIRGRPITMYIPSNIQNYDDLRMELPSEKLELDWVYGYRGRDCRANLYLLPSGEAVFFIACVVVLYDITKCTQRHYLKHTDCVRSVCLCSQSLQASVHIWDSSTLVTLQQIGLGSFERGVSSVAFSHADSGAFLCVVDESNEHMLSVWDCNKGTKQAEIKKYKKPKFIQCFVFSGTGDVLTGDSEGNILTWGKSAADVKTLGKGAKVEPGGGGFLPWIPEKFGAVRTIAEVDGEELLVGTTRNAILRGTFSGGFMAIVQGHVDEMWGLATHPSQSIFITCGHDKQVCLWNTEDHRLDWSTTLEESGLCADFCPNGSVVSVGLNTGRWVVLDLQTREVVSDYTDGNEQLSVMRYSPDGSFLAVGSHDNFIYIYNVTENGRRYTRFGKCTVSKGIVVTVYWDVAGGCKLLRNRFESKDREWASYTCVLGFHVMGVWLEGSDGTDINALCRSHSERVVAVADDFCKVHLFQYPCPKPKAPSHKYEGHGSHVTNVCFTHNDSHLISMGGKDTCILQWRVSGRSAAGSLDRSSSVSSTSISSLEAAT